MSDSNNFDKDSEKQSTDFSFNSSPVDETDLSGMDIASAKEYVTAYITTLRQTQNKIKELTDEHAIWEKRASFARERGREDLAAAAEIKATEISGILNSQKNEEKELAVKVSKLLENMKKLKSVFIPTVDAERLQAELEMITGERDDVAEKIKEEETLAELEKLKQKMNDDGSI